MEEDKLSKQKYLRDEIINSGLNPLEFTNFLQSKRENGTDIDSWTQLQLEELVKDFKIMIGQIQQQQDSQNQKKSEIIIQHQIQNSSNLQQTLDIENKQNTYLGLTQNVQVNIKQYEKIEGGIFQYSYIVYKIKTMPFEYEVKRRYSDFCELREILIKDYPAHYVPPIPKRTNSRNFEPYFVNKRMSFLEKFLQKIIQSPVLKNSKYVEEFLMSDETKLKNSFKKYEKIQLNFENQGIFDRKLDIEQNKDLENFLGKASSLFSSSSIIYKKIRQLSKILITNMGDMSTTLFDLADCFSQLYQQSNNFNLSVKEEYRIPLLDDLYITLNHIEISWGNSLNKQMKLIQQNFSDHFKFYQNEFFQIQQMLKNRDNIYKEYQSFSSKLQEKKDKYFYYNIDNWDLTKECLTKYTQDELKSNKILAQKLMFPKDNILDLQNMKMSNYYTTTLNNEIMRIFRVKVNDYCQNFSNFIQQQTLCITDTHLQWADVQANFISLQNGQKIFLNDEIQNYK